MAHILVVDDDPAIRTLVTRFLVTAGHTVVEAEDGDQAMALLQTDSVDLVITDVVMPDKGGIQAVMEIHDLYPDMPTMIMSGKVPLGTDAMGGLMKQYGSRAVLPKPFTREELLEAIAVALGS